MGIPWYDDQTPVLEQFLDRYDNVISLFVTFTEYPPNGWLGVCDFENCAGEEPTSMIIG